MDSSNLGRSTGLARYAWSSMRGIFTLSISIPPPGPYARSRTRRSQRLICGRSIFFGSSRSKRLAVERHGSQYRRGILPCQIPTFVENRKPFVFDHIGVIDEALEADSMLFKVFANRIVSLSRDMTHCVVCHDIVSV